MIVRAPATSANLGPGFDCAAVALDLWNDLELADGDGVVVEGAGAGELPEDATNLAVMAYALLADPTGKLFRFTNRIPLERVRPDREVRRVLGQLSRARAGVVVDGAVRQLELVPEV